MTSEVADFGTTEARRKTLTKLEPRGVSNGGRVITVGIKNEIPDLLEALYISGNLKAFYEPESAALRRVTDGRALQELYLFFNSKGKDLAAAEMVYRIMPTLEGHVGDDRDVSETVFLETLRRLGKFANVVRSVCVDGRMVRTSGLLRGLDILPKAMEAVENEVHRRLKKND